MKKIFSLIFIIAVIFSFAACDSEKKDDEPSISTNDKTYKEKYGVYFELNGEIIDISDRGKYTTTVHNSWLTVDYSPYTLDEAIKKLSKNDLPYFVARVKCAGPYKNIILTNIDTNEENAAHYKHLPTSDSKFNTSPPYKAVELQFSRIPIKIVDVLEGDLSLVQKDQVIELELDDVFLIQKDGLNFYLPSELNNVIFREGYEYVVLIQYYPETGCYVSTLHMLACELSAPKDQVDFKCSFTAGNYTNYKNMCESGYYTDDELMSPVYWEILERYNIEIE